VRLESALRQQMQAHHVICIGSLFTSRHGHLSIHCSIR
jgi:hypothetical protein